ncbi:MAG TPA: hypothetical protein VGG89_13925 [Candidatus Baltobacteraceae bacterium]
MRMLRYPALCAAFLAALYGAASAAVPSPFAKLEFRSIGPTTGRIDAVAGVPGNSQTYYAGGLGGLWLTTDGGVTWQPIFDKQPVSSIGAIAVAPSNPKIVYVGTGEPNMRNDIAFGDGVWRSDDGGKTWRHLGLDGTSQIAQIAVDPHNPDVAYVAAVGDPFAPGTSRGVYVTRDGGKHWVRSLYTGPTTGASTVAISPANPSYVIAGTWTVQRRPWMLTSGGPADGIFVSHDAGAHWARLSGNGLPNGLMGRIGVRFAPSDPRRVYAVIESKSGVFWSSNDGGAHWRLASDKHVLDQRPYYFSQFTIDPKDPKHIFFMSIFPNESFDGGKSIKKMDTNGYDHHQMWIDPARGKRAIIAADAGVRLSLDGGKTWRDPQLIVSQPYHISVDDEMPYTICGEFQDPGAVCGPSMSFSGAITPDQWFSPNGGESGWIVFSPANPNVIYSTGYQEAVIRYDRTSMATRLISPWPDTYSGTGADAYKYRGAWVAPVAVSSLEPNALYFGAQMLLRTDDGGSTWTAISADLTRNDKSKQVASGRPITVDNAGTEVYDTIACIAESPTVKGEIWVGTDDGLAWLTRDGGAHWTNVTAALSGLPQWARIENIDPSAAADGTAYLAAENHKLGDRAPYLYVTHDFGAHWSSIVSNLPRESYVRMIREDPKRAGLIYAGTETGLWYSLDAGVHWDSLQNNLAHVPVYDFVVQPRFDDLVVATHGRGVWILDDIRALQEWKPQIVSERAHLFTPGNAYRWNGTRGTWATGEGAGDNPPGLGDVTFYLGVMPEKKHPAKVEILDGSTVIRSINVEHPVVGMNRVWWDLMYDTVPLVADYHAQQGGFTGPQALPGDYTVRLIANGTQQDAPLHVLADPHTPATVAEMRDAFALAMQLRDGFTRTGKEIEALRALQKKLAQTAKLARASDTRHAIVQMQQTATAALAGLYIADAQSSEDTLREPSRLYERIPSLASSMIGNDYAPTQGQRELAVSLQTDLKEAIASDDSLFGASLQSLNALLQRDRLTPISLKRN